MVISTPMAGHIKCMAGNEHYYLNINKFNWLKSVCVKKDLEYYVEDFNTEVLSAYNNSGPRKGKKKKHITWLSGFLN